MMRVQKLTDNAVAPSRGSKQAAGYDFCSIETKTIYPGCAVKFRTGIAIELPSGYHMEMRPRSGLAFKHRVEAFNGTIDSDYRGEVLIQLKNYSQSEYEVKEGERIAQGVILRHEELEVTEAEDLSETDRGTGGFGSTGK